MPVKYKTSISTSGPFFRGDPLKKWADNKRAFMEEWARQGEADVIGRMHAGESNRKPIKRLGGRVSDHVRGRAVSLTGKHWRATGVVSVNNVGFSDAQAISLMAAASRVERQTHAFRSAKGALRRARSVNLDMLKGLR